MDILDPAAFEAGIRAVVARSHNLPPEMRQEVVGEFISEVFDTATEKCGQYLCGSQIFEREGFGKTDGYFNGISLGNWLTVAARAGVPFIPARLLASASPTVIYAGVQGIKMHEPQQSEFDAFMADLQWIKPGEMLRFDMCAAATIKARLSDGGPIQSGWFEEDLVKYPDVDGRIIHALLNYTFEYLPVFARPIIPLRMVEGDAPDHPLGRWPREWRVFVNEGRVTGVSNYYLQAPAKASESAAAAKAAELAQAMIGALIEAKSWPHHPRMEGVFNTEAVSCSLDFAEGPGGELVLVEGGPPHIFSPPWGAHPCCFTPGAPLEGIALALGHTPIPAKFDDGVSRMTRQGNLPPDDPNPSRGPTSA
jgi:hypothetical protein